MLRSTVVALFVVALAATVACIGLSAAHLAASPVVFCVWLALQLAIVLAGFIFERFRYKPLDTTAPHGFVATAERFVDPASGRAVQVWFNAATGERRYVTAPESSVG